MQNEAGILLLRKNIPGETPSIPQGIATLLSGWHRSCRRPTRAFNSVLTVSKICKDAPPFIMLKWWVLRIVPELFQRFDGAKKERRAAFEIHDSTDKGPVKTQVDWIFGRFGRGGVHDDRGDSSGFCAFFIDFQDRFVNDIPDEEGTVVGMTHRGKIGSAGIQCPGKVHFRQNIPQGAGPFHFKFGNGQGNLPVFLIFQKVFHGRSVPAGEVAGKACAFFGKHEEEAQAVVVIGKEYAGAAAVGEIAFVPGAVVHSMGVSQAADAQPLSRAAERKRVKNRFFIAETSCLV